MPHARFWDHFMIEKCDCYVPDTFLGVYVECTVQILIVKDVISLMKWPLFIDKNYWFFPMKCLCKLRIIISGYYMLCI